MFRNVIVIVLLSLLTAKVIASDSSSSRVPLSFGEGQMLTSEALANHAKFFKLCGKYDLEMAYFFLQAHEKYGPSFKTYTLSQGMDLEKASYDRNSSEISAKFIKMGEFQFTNRFGLVSTNEGGAYRITVRNTLEDSTYEFNVTPNEDFGCMFIGDVSE